MKLIQNKNVIQTSLFCTSIETQFRHVWYSYWKNVPPKRKVSGHRKVSFAWRKGSIYKVNQSPILPIYKMRNFGYSSCLTLAYTSVENDKFWKRFINELITNKRRLLLVLSPTWHVEHFGILELIVFSVTPRGHSRNMRKSSPPRLQLHCRLS